MLCLYSYNTTEEILSKLDKNATESILLIEQNHERVIVVRNSSISITVASGGNFMGLETFPYDKLKSLGLFGLLLIHTWYYY